MTTVQITLPDALAQRARSEGLLSDNAITGVRMRHLPLTRDRVKAALLA